MFVYASAFCAILLKEPERAAFLALLMKTRMPQTSPVAVWETVRAVVRETEPDVVAAQKIVLRLLQAADVQMTSIGVAEQDLALEAFDRFGKGRHPAALNMGDCFAYACARSLGVPLLYKGGDFSQTDIEAAG